MLWDICLTLPALVWRWDDYVGALSHGHKVTDFAGAGTPFAFHAFPVDVMARCLSRSMMTRAWHLTAPGVIPSGVRSVPVGNLEFDRAAAGKSEPRKR